MRLSIPSALPRLLGTSLRRRLAVSIALVHALMMAVFVFDLSLRERQLLVKNTERTHAALGKVLRDGLLYTLAAILLGTLLALLIAADLTRDLRRVKALFLRVSAGELDQRIEVVRRDELGDLMHGLNHMLERLEADEQLLRETRERLELALQGSNDGLWDWNLVSDTVYFSPRWKAMLGYGEDEIGEAPAE